MNIRHCFLSAPVEEVSQGDLWGWMQQQYRAVMGGEGGDESGSEEQAGDPPPLTVVSQLTYSGTVSPGGSTTSFGQMFPSYSLSATYAAADNTITVGGTVNGLFRWCVNANGHTDVPSGDDAVVTAEEHAPSGKKVWEAIRDDLTPRTASPHKSPRAHFWVEDLTEQHEKFHADDFNQWCGSIGIADLNTFLATQTVASESALQGVVATGVRTHISRGAIDYYLGGATTHGQRAGEITAYADGKDQYQEIADAAAVRGAELEAESGEEEEQEESTD